MTQLIPTHISGMWLSQSLSDCWMKCSSRLISGHAVPVNAEMGQRLPCSSGPIVSSVRQAGEIAVKSSLGLSAEEKLPDQLRWCDGEPWLSSDRHGGRAHGESGFRCRWFPPHWNIYNCPSAIVGPLSRNNFIFSGITEALLLLALPVMWHDGGL